MSKLAMGVLVLHDGDEDFKLTNIDAGKGGAQIATFENEKRRVRCDASELVFLKEENAWYLPGRILSREQRREFMRIAGTSTPPADHVMARKVLKA